MAGVESPKTFKPTLLASLVLFQVFVLLIVLASTQTPKQFCPKILSYYDTNANPVEISIFRSERIFWDGKDLQRVCRYERITVDSLRFGGRK